MASIKGILLVIVCVLMCVWPTDGEERQLDEQLFKTYEQYALKRTAERARDPNAAPMGSSVRTPDETYGMVKAFERYEDPYGNESWRKNVVHPNQPEAEASKEFEEGFDGMGETFSKFHDTVYHTYASDDENSEKERPHPNVS